VAEVVVDHNAEQEPVVEVVQEVIVHLVLVQVLYKGQHKV
tara:strand:- start:1488 stop:1607 length:120 start_codon:yes stop_codon:yes gene_type:complete